MKSNPLFFGICFVLVGVYFAAYKREMRAIRARFWHKRLWGFGASEKMYNIASLVAGLVFVIVGLCLIFRYIF